MEWNWNLSIGFRQAVSETISVKAGARIATALIV